MECDRAAGLLSGLLDAALGRFERLRVNRHVAGCANCTAKLEELRAMQAAIRTNLPYHRAPPGLAARIGAALEREAPPVSAAAASRPWFRWPAVGMAGSDTFDGRFDGVPAEPVGGPGSYTGRPGSAHGGLRSRDCQLGKSVAL